MKKLVLGLVLRIAKGERYKDLAPTEMRCQFAAFAFIPFFIGTFIYIGHPLLHGGLAMLCFALLASLSLACLVVVGWAMFVPLKASRILSVILWILLIWVVAHLDFTKFAV